ncbi:hypothetical protein [Tenacibaculum maritimum]|uniref:hypothetical protein n=2 Tax=Tenacibaculum maritimum TaxID=107401 RepID=UPI000417BC54|nr:hypothetical protein [Tenacibaculum maritimum]MCD9583320.1 hypothetical protein [Tenacibaculum maritimum]MCD9612192.1 hypothetical protein [Tenacibaculum maritimum]MCD9637440.1 hypothetical protein [Tenacibaculum maritimum]CAA0145207.1 hypothetical protein TM902_190002 [Tenacibaculum maritimum]CAA0173143.1 hypothetical protein TMP445_200008 [Tenacibaculum maritimum]
MSNTNVNISGYNFEFNDELDLWEVFVNNYQIYLNKDFRRDYGVEFVERIKNNKIEIINLSNYAIPLLKSFSAFFDYNNCDFKIEYVKHNGYNDFEIGHSIDCLHSMDTDGKWIALFEEFQFVGVKREQF